MTGYKKTKHYVRVSNELFKEFDKLFKKEVEFELVYLNHDNDKVSTTSKISKFLNIDDAEYMDIKEGTRIRLDKILSYNGKSTKTLNHY